MRPRAPDARGRRRVFGDVARPRSARDGPSLCCPSSILRDRFPIQLTGRRTAHSSRGRAGSTKRCGVRPRGRVDEGRGRYPNSTNSQGQRRGGTGSATGRLGVGAGVLDRAEVVDEQAEAAHEIGRPVGDPQVPDRRGPATSALSTRTGPTRPWTTSRSRSSPAGVQRRPGFQKGWPAVVTISSPSRTRRGVAADSDRSTEEIVPGRASCIRPSGIRMRMAGAEGPDRPGTVGRTARPSRRRSIRQWSSFHSRNAARASKTSACRPPRPPR